MQSESNQEPNQGTLNDLIHKMKSTSVDKVAQEIRKLIRSFPLSVNLWKFGCIVHSQLNDHRAAIQSGKRALLIMPEDASLYQTVGNALNSKKSYKGIFFYIVVFAHFGLFQLVSTENYKFFYFWIIFNKISYKLFTKRSRSSCN